MKKQIRKGVFETNSSSTHTMVIATNLPEGEPVLPEELRFRYGEFGWEHGELKTPKEKASYLYTALVYELYNEASLWNQYILFIANTLKENNVNAIFEGEITSEIRTNDSGTYIVYVTDPESYVDHGSEALEFVDAVCTDKELLINYLFSDKSFIITGNDNDEDPVILNLDYDHAEFFKGN